MQGRDPKTYELWPGKVPGDVGIDGEEYYSIHDTVIVGKTGLVTNVTRPAITVYLPADNANTGTAMLICPGGGYHALYWDLEGVEVAEWLNTQGIAGIILKYRCPRRAGDLENVPPLGPQMDAQRALRLVRYHAREWGIDPARIGIGGFSAGGHVAITAAAEFEDRKYDPVDEMDATSCRPDFAVACYSGYLQRDHRYPGARDLVVSPDTPPAFFAHTSDDTISDVQNSLDGYGALHRAGIPAELHIYSSGQHDFGVRQADFLPSSWPGLFLRWLRSLGLLEKALP